MQLRTLIRFIQRYIKFWRWISVVFCRGRKNIRQNETSVCLHWLNSSGLQGWTMSAENLLTFWPSTQQEFQFGNEIFISVSSSHNKYNLPQNTHKNSWRKRNRLHRYEDSSQWFRFRLNFATDNIYAFDFCTCIKSLCRTQNREVPKATINRNI